MTVYGYMTPLWVEVIIEARVLETGAMDARCRRKIDGPPHPTTHYRWGTVLGTLDSISKCAILL